MEATDAPRAPVSRQDGDASSESSPAHPSFGAGDGLVVVEPPRPRPIRSARLQVRVVGAAAFAGAAIAVCSLTPAGLSGIERDLLRGVAQLPEWLTDLLVTLSQAVAAYTPLAVVLALLVFRRWKRLAVMLVGFGVAAVATDRLRQELFDEGPISSGIRELFENRLAAPAGFPDAGYLAGIVVLLVVEGSWLPVRWRRVVRIAVGVLVLSRLASGTILPRNVLLAVAIGTLVGRLAQLLFGGPEREPSGRQLATALGQMGIAVRRVAAHDRGTSTEWLVDTVDDRRLLVQVTSRETRSALAPARIYRAIRLRNLGEERPFASVEHLAEHEALAALKAHDGGVPTPRLVDVGRAEPNSVMVVFDHRRGRRFPELEAEALTDEVLDRAWRLVARLREARIAHRRLRCEHLWLDESGEVFITGFQRAELGAHRELLGNDVAELLVSTASQVGVERAADRLVATLGRGPANDALPRLQPLALSSATRREVNGSSLIADAAEEVRDRTGSPAFRPAELERVRPRSLLLVVLVGVAAYLLAPQIAGAGDTWTQVRGANPWWFAAMLAISATTYAGAALAMSGAVPARLPFRANTITQLAAAFTGFATPAQLGGMALNTRFMQRQGVDPPVAVAAVGLNAVSAVVVHFILLVAFAIGTGSDGLSKIDLPSTGTIAIGAAVLAGAAGLLLALPFGRRLVVDRVAPFLRQAGQGLAEVGRHPAKLAELFGGAALVTGGNAIALWMAVSALGGGVSVATIGFVYLTASVVASAAPTPGGLGAVEATLVAGLRGAGLEGSNALGAVLLFRLATFWLPILPGILAFRHLERTEQI